MSSGPALPGIDPVDRSSRERAEPWGTEQASSFAVWVFRLGVFAFASLLAGCTNGTSTSWQGDVSGLPLDGLAFIAGSACFEQLERETERSSELNRLGFNAHGDAYRASISDIRDGLATGSVTIAMDERSCRLSVDIETGVRRDVDGFTDLWPFSQGFARELGGFSGGRGPQIEGLESNYSTFAVGSRLYRADNALAHTSDIGSSLVTLVRVR